MFPFAFDVPLASQHGSPAASRSPPRAKGTSPNPSSNVSSNDPFYKETYAEKKANWKSSLRKPHPFLSREPYNGYQIARTRSNSSKSDSSRASNDYVVAPVRRVVTLRLALTLSIIILSATVLVVGMIYADDLASDVSITRQGESAIAAIGSGLQTGVEQGKGDKELLVMRKVAIKDDKRANLDPVINIDADEPNALDQPKLSRLRGGLHNLVGKHDAPILASLFFYVATLPLLSIMHACLDLVMFYLCGHMNRNQKSPSSSSPSFIDSDDDSFCDSDTEEINEEKFKHELAYPALPVSPELTLTSTENPAPKPRFQRLAHILPITSILSTVLVVEGWIVINGIQVHCEFAQSEGVSAVCPPQLSQLSVSSRKQQIQSMSFARAVFSWAIVLIYIAQIITTIIQFKVFSLRKLRGQGPSNDAEANVDTSLRIKSPPRTPSSILSRSRSRSNSTRRKTVRFDLEEASRRQSERGEDVQYIPAPSDGYDNGYGLAYSYSTNHAYSNNGTGNDVRTPWQWQGQFEDFVNKNDPSGTHNTDTMVAATTGTDLGIVPAEHRGASNFEFGLASMRRIAREEEQTGFLSSGLQGSTGKISQTLGLNTTPSTTMAAGLKTSLEQQTGTLASADTSAVVPLMFSSSMAPSNSADALFASVDNVELPDLPIADEFINSLFDGGVDAGSDIFTGQGQN